MNLAAINKNGWGQFGAVAGAVGIFIGLTILPLGIVLASLYPPDTLSIFTICYGGAVSLGSITLSGFLFKKSLNVEKNKETLRIAQEALNGA